MSDLEKNLDYISFCPSIIEILQFVGFPGVLSCKLVNRRLGAVILSNANSMPKKQMELHLQTGDTNLAEIELKCPTGTRILLMYVTDNLSIVVKGNKLIDRYYSERGDSYPLDRILEDALPQKRLILDHIKSIDQNLEDGSCYGHSGMADEMKNLMILIAPKYHFTSLHVASHENTMSGLLADSLEKTHLHCDKLFLLSSICMSESSRIIRAVDPFETTFGLCSCSKKSLCCIIENVVRLNENRTSVRLHFIRRRAEILAFLKKWERGEISLNKLVLRDSAPSQATWPQGALNELFIGLKDTSSGLDKESQKKYICVKRSTDDRALQIWYDNNGELISSILEVSTQEKN